MAHQISHASLGVPHLHLRLTGSTNDRARELAAKGAPHGTLVTAAEQSAGRGRQGRTWSAPASRALLCSLIIRPPAELLSLRAGVAVAEAVETAAAGRQAMLKWPNDVLVSGRKVAGILVEARPQEGWAVLGIGINVALRPEDFPPELRDRAGTLGLEPESVAVVLNALLHAAETALAMPLEQMLDRVRERDALVDRPVAWAAGHGTGAGIDEVGRLLVRRDDGRTEALDAGEIHLLSPPPD